MARGTKITGIPAVPAQPSAGHYQFESAIKQGIERHDAELASATDAISRASKFSDGHVYTNNPASGSKVFQPSPANGFLQRVMNNGAHTLAPPTANCCITLLYYNTASAGAITVSGFTKVTGTSAPPSNSTTAAQYFMARITVIEGKSWLEWQAMQ